MTFSVILMNKKNVSEKCSSLPGITVDVRQCKFRYNIINFDKKRSVPQEILSEVEVSVVKMNILSWDNSIFLLSVQTGFDIILMLK